MEGVMMKNGDQYAVAVRKADNNIEVKREDYKSPGSKCRLFKLPFIRGVANFVDSMVLGISTLTYSASLLEEVEDEEPSKFEKALDKTFGKKAESVVMGFTVVLSLVIAIGLFMVLPLLLTNLLGKKIDNKNIQLLVEGVIRIALFLLYVFLISFMKDIKRTYMYHGAEHKTINCVEHGLDLTVENVRSQSRRHKRCGTSFLLIVMFISIVFFMFIRTDTLWLKILLRVVLVPAIAGVSYEFLRLCGNTDNKVINFLCKPGLWLQGLTTREPDDSMIEVAIASVEAVFDWKAYVEKYREDQEKIARYRNRHGKSRKESQLSDKPSLESYDDENDEIDDILNALDKMFVDKTSYTDENADGSSYIAAESESNADEGVTADEIDRAGEDSAAVGESKDDADA